MIIFISTLVLMLIYLRHPFVHVNYVNIEYNGFQCQFSVDLCSELAKCGVDSFTEQSKEKQKCKQ